MEETNYKPIKITLRFLFCWAIFLLVSSTIYANSKETVLIRGRIIDRDRQPVPFSSVYITHPQTPTAVVRGTVSNNEGVFALQAAHNSLYTLHVAFLGYKEYAVTVKTDSTEVNMGDIVLEEGALQLANVTVKPPLEVTADKIIYRFENDPARAKSSLFDLIGNMPLITIDPNGKVIVGDKNKTYIVLRKGREDALFNFQNITFEELIRKLPAMGFTTFEIWTVIPPKYSQYDYVINILPDPNQRLFGMVGAPSFSYDFERGALQAGLGGNGSADIFRFSGGVTYGHTDAPKNTRTTTTTFYETESVPESLYGQHVENRFESDTRQANLAASLDITKRQFITFHFRASFGNSENNRYTTTERKNAENWLYRSLSKYMTISESDTWSAGATYQFDFRKPNRALSVSYLYSSAPSQRSDFRETAYTEGTGTDEAGSAKDDVTGTTHRVQFDYYDQFWNDKLKFNAQAGYLTMNYNSEGRTLNELTGAEEVDKYTRLKQDFHRIDGLVNFSYNANKRLNVSTKLTADYLPDYNYTQSTTGTFIETVRQKELLLTPDVQLSYRFRIAEPKKKKAAKPYDEMTINEKIAFLQNAAATGKNVNDLLSGAIVPNSSVRFMYQYRQRRPGISQLTNYVDEEDPLYIRRGNPGLRPESDHLFNFAFSSWFIQSMATSFSFSNDKIVAQSRREGDRIVQSFYNAGRNRYFSLGLSHTFFLVSLNPSFSHLKTNYGDGTWREQNTLSVSASRSLMLLKNLTGSMKLTYSKPFNSGVTGEEKNIPVNLSLSLNYTPKLFGNMAFITMSFNDILQWDRRTRSYTNMPDYRQLTESRSRGLPFSVSIRATFGKFKVKPVRGARGSVTGFSTDPE